MIGFHTKHLDRKWVQTRRILKKHQNTMKNFNNMKKTLCVIMALGTLLEASKAQTN